MPARPAFTAFVWFQLLFFPAGMDIHLLNKATRIPETITEIVRQKSVSNFQRNVVTSEKSLIFSN